MVRTCPNRKTDHRGIKGMEKYVQMALEEGLLKSAIISPDDVFMDIRAILKCRWGCEYSSENSIRCGQRNTSFEERAKIINSYSHILLAHSNDAQKLSQALLKIERAAFLDGLYFAFTIRACNLCRTCSVQQGGPCPTPEKIRPCDQSFGIDVYKTVRRLGFPCEVLQSREDKQNRYGFVLLD